MLLSRIALCSVFCCSSLVLMLQQVIFLCCISLFFFSDLAFSHCSSFVLLLQSPYSDVTVDLFWCCKQVILLMFASRIAPCCNRSFQWKFFSLDIRGDGAQWGWGVEGNGYVGDGGTTGDGDATRHGGTLVFRRGGALVLFVSYRCGPVGVRMRAHASCAFYQSFWH
jgi:hypothetical protein